MNRQTKQAHIEQAKQRAAQRVRLERKREAAKWGMMVSMGVLVGTGYFRTRTMRQWHVIAGVALLGFSYWHHVLYNRKNSKIS